MYKIERLIDVTNTKFDSNNTYQKYIGYITFNELFTIETIYYTARKCAQGFQHKKDTQVFFKTPLSNSYKLLEKLRAGTFKPTYYPSRIINERGKQRIITPPTFECKIVQKVICDYLVRPLLEPKMISTNYASIKGRGTAKMYSDIYKSLMRYKNNYSDIVIVTTDYSNYFASINTDILINMLSKYIKDKQILTLIKSFSPDNYGLSLGNELSQVPASFYPSYIDHYMKDKLGLKDYFRYMDDILFLCKKEDVKRYIGAIVLESKKLELQIKPDKINIISYGVPFIFCKERFLWNSYTFNYYRMQNPAITKNEKRKLKAFERMYKEGKIEKEEIERQYKGVRGMVKSHVNNGRKIMEIDGIYGENFSAI